MNCNEITRILDEGAMAALTGREMRALEAHLAECPGCADQCLASERMLLFRTPVPPVPDSVHEAARCLRERSESEPAMGRTRRPLLIGSLLLLGAAATMFSAVPWQDAGAANR